MADKQQYSELTQLGIKFYEENLKTILEPEHNGEFVAIEPYLEKYVIDKNGTKALIEARSKMPNSKFYLARIGFKTTDRIGSYGTRKR